MGRYRFRTRRSRTNGRPDFKDHNYGKSWLKRFPPYVYSLLGGMLIHRVLRVEAQWYEPASPYGECLERLESPRLTIHAACGQVFYAGTGKRARRSQTCVLPKPGAVPCGRCVGTGPVFGRGLAELTVLRRDARRRIGCVMDGVVEAARPVGIKPVEAAR
jgi:hypothetical protein